MKKRILWVGLTIALACLLENKQGQSPFIILLEQLNGDCPCLLASDTGGIPRGLSPPADGPDSAGIRSKTAAFLGRRFRARPRGCLTGQL